MDHELKQRLIGAVVVTALAAIFIPMLFDDPVDTTGKTVTELAIPQAPSDTVSPTATVLPENKADVVGKTDTELSVSEDEDVEQLTLPKEESSDNPMLNDQPIDATATGSEDGLKNSGEQETAKDNGNSSTPELDTGVVEEPVQNRVSTSTPVKPIEPVKKPKPVVEKTIKKSVVAEKPKEKAVVADKIKPIAKTEPVKTDKSAKKMVRYSIQAGSFSKKENAQALVDKLRKQGLPATLSSKGTLFRVKIGPELDKKKAADMKAKLDKQNISSLITSE